MIFEQELDKLTRSYTIQKVALQKIPSPLAFNLMIGEMLPQMNLRTRESLNHAIRKTFYLANLQSNMLLKHHMITRILFYWMRRMETDCGKKSSIDPSSLRINSEERLVIRL